MCCGDGDDFRHLVRVEFAQALLQGGVSFGGCFEDGQNFGAGFHAALPAIDGLQLRAQIDTSRQLRFDDHCDSLARFSQVRKRR